MRILPTIFISLIAVFSQAALIPVDGYSLAKMDKIRPQGLQYDEAPGISGLPHETANYRLNVQPIAKAKDITLSFVLDLPETQKMPNGAPAFVAVFEKIKGEWKEAARFSLREFFFFGDALSFSRSVHFSSEDSEVAVSATIYHCGKDHKTPCYIQSYQGLVKRRTQAGPRLSFEVKAMAPAY